MTARELLHALELRVFEGPQKGARAPLAAGVSCVVAAHPEGRAEGADVVLREAGAAPVRVRVTADLRDALIEVLEGEVFLGEQPLAAGAQAPWAMHAPLRIGRSVVAFGRAMVAEWHAALPGARAGAKHAAAPVAPAGSAAPRKPLRSRAEFWLATMGGAVLVVCAAALWTARTSAAPVSAPPAERVSLPAALRASEFSALEASSRPDGRFDVRGRLATQAQLAQFEAWLAERQFRATVDVQVDESLARDVTETFRINGVAVKAQVAGVGVVSVEAAEREADRLARAEEVVRRDVRGLQKLAVRNTATPAPKPLPPVPADPGKRIASLVPGDTAYLVTADGARYFVGSMLPSGHRITAIGAQSVTLEHDGRESSLNF